MPKPSRSPLYFYASEYQRRYQHQNGKRININEAIAAYYDNWKGLSDEEKQVYKNQYEEWRIQYRINPNVCDKPKKPLPEHDILCDRVLRD